MGWLVLAGEPSGDRIAASAVRALGLREKPWGVGGDAMREAGVELVAHTSELAAMGVGDVVRRAPAIARALFAIGTRVRADPPRAALLANFTELSSRLGPLLRRRGTKVLWCVAPQVWAWRPKRIETLRNAMDRLAVILPFEEALWRKAGVDATFVGHPSLELVRETSRVGARAALKIATSARAVAVLPGSRAGEIARLAEPFAKAARLLRERGAVDRAMLIVAPNISIEARQTLDLAARRHELEIVVADPERGAAAMLAAFDVTLCASGTACLEAALAGAPPVVGYRLDPLAFAVARRLVTSEHIALPNILLNRRVCTELIQDELTAERAADAAERWLADRAGAEALAAELSEVLTPKGSPCFGKQVAELMSDWLAG